MNDVVIVSAARTPIGRYGGALRDVHPAELGAVAARAAIARAELAPGDVDEVLFGQARQAGSGPNPARQVGRRAGVPDAAPAFTVNKACGSGLQAPVSGAGSIMLGDSAVVLAGGIESMSRVPYLVDAVDGRWGHRMGNFALVDAMYRDGFQCPLSNLIMGETAEVLAPVTANGSVIERDEHPRGDTTIEGLRKLPPVFGAAGGDCRNVAPTIITAGSSSGVTDGGAARGLATLCVSGGMGMALAIEAIRDDRGGRDHGGTSATTCA